MAAKMEIAPQGYLPLFYRRPVPISVYEDAPESRDEREQVWNGNHTFDTIQGSTEASHDTSASWGVLLDAMYDFDQRKIHRWKEELSLLLLFAGLFSIAVSVFIGQAQAMLQPDSGSTTAFLLSQILQQLTSSLTSTGPETSPMESLPTFTPSDGSVRLNILWILSLTLSLITAFFTITILQWLRRFPAPRQMSIRESVRLRQFRHTGLSAWQVETIIALLPIVLQVAIVLFLVGLLYLLQALNHATLEAFAIVAGIALLFYLILALIPAFLPHSPYKSSLVPILAIIARAIAVPLAVFGLIFLIVSIYMLTCFLYLVRLLLSSASQGRWGSYRLIGAAISWRTTLQTWLKRWTAFKLEDFTNLEQVWWHRERNAMAGRNAELDGAAVAWAPYGLPQQSLHRVRPCLNDISQQHRTRSALEWAGLHLGNFSWHDLHEYSRYSLVNPNVLSQVTVDGGAFARQLRDLFLETLPKDWSAQNYLRDDPAIAGILVILLETMRDVHGTGFNSSEAGILASFTRLLMAICVSQFYDRNAEISASHFATNASRVPTSLLFECCVGGEYEFDRQEALESLGWASQQLAGAAALGAATANRHILNVLELVIGSSATALHTFLKQPALLSEDDSQQQCRVFFADLSRFLEKYKSEIKLNASVCSARSTGTVRLVFSRALVSISTSLVHLLENGRIPTGDNCPSGPLYGRVLEVCRDEPSLADAMPHLQQFYDLLMNRRATNISITAVPSPRASMRRDTVPPTQTNGAEKGLPLTPE